MSIMMSNCTETLVSLMRRHFEYLFTRCGFKVIHAESYRGGEYCFIVLESSACRVKMDYQLGAIGLAFGALSAPLSIEDRGWYDLELILDFLKNKPTDLAKMLSESKTLWSLSDSEFLAYLSSRLEPVCQEVIDLFREESVEQRQRFHAYIEQSEREIERQLDEREHSQGK